MALTGEVLLEQPRALGPEQRAMDLAGVAELAVAASLAAAARLGVVGSLATAELSKVFGDGVPGPDPLALTCYFDGSKHDYK